MHQARSDPSSLIFESDLHAFVSFNFLTRVTTVLDYLPPDSRLLGQARSRRHKTTVHINHICRVYRTKYPTPLPARCIALPNHHPRRAELASRKQFGIVDDERFDQAGMKPWEHLWVVGKSPGIP